MKVATFSPSPRQRNAMLVAAFVAWLAITMLFVNGVGVTHSQGNMHMSALDSAGLVFLGLLVVRFLAVGIDDIFRF
jgi:hypothetical protein